VRLDSLDVVNNLHSGIDLWQLQLKDVFEEGLKLSVIGEGTEVVVVLTLLDDLLASLCD